MNSFVALCLDAAVYLRYPHLIRRHRRHVGRWPRPMLPRGFRDKLFWRKLFDRDPRFPQWADKLAAKRLVAENFPDIAVPETLWEGTDPDAIPDAVLARDCVVKANHGCSWNILVRAGTADRAQIARRARRWLRTVHGRRHLEWAYSRIEPRLFVEEMVMDGGGPVSDEYKFSMAGGEIMYVYVKRGRHGAGSGEFMLDHEGKSHRIFVENGRWSEPLGKPAHWDALADAARRLSAPFDYVRVDFYETGGRIVFSELTFYPQAGYDMFDWPEVEERIARSWDIRRSWFMTTPQPGWRARYRRWLAAALDGGR